MGTLDLYEDGFPHGTKEGFAKGCKGIACPNHGTGVVTCKDAFLRFNSDYRFRKLVEAGHSPEEIAEIEAAVAAVPDVKKAAPKPRPSKPLTVEPVVNVEDEEPVTEPERLALVRGRHGSTSHFDKGCRHAECVAAHEAAEKETASVAAPESAVDAEGEDPGSEISESPWQVSLTAARHEELLAAEEQYRTALERLDQMDRMAGELQTARQELAIAQARVVELTLELDVAKAQHHLRIPADGAGRPVTVTIQIGA